MQLEQLLKHHQFIVIKAESGKEALQKLEETPEIAMVLTDYVMPEMDGLKLIHQIRTKKTSFDLPVIVLSMHEDGHKISDCLKAGANDYLHKPYKIEEFLSRVYMNLNNSANMLQIKEQQLLLKQYKNAIDETSIVSKANISGKITYVNDMFCEVSGYSKEELVGNTHNIVRHPDTSIETFEILWKTILGKKVWNGVIKNRKKNDDTYIVDTTIIPILNASNEIEEFISIRKDMTQVIEQNTIIQKQYTDPMTKLPNRTKLIHDLELMSSASLVIINIDSFNEINSFYGYDLADRLLVEVAKKIRNLTSKIHYIYKLPIDEYALLGEHISETEEKIFISDSLKKLSGHSFMIDDNEIFLHFSVGIYSGSEDHLVKADVALQQSKIMKKDICAYGDLPDLKNAVMMKSFCEEIQLLDVTDYIVFEIVESDELESTELFAAIEQLKQQGIKISIDDFGTGYSNFDYLIKLKADFIKIDGSIVKNILTDQNAELMVKTIVNIAKELGSKTIAEFVENEAIYEKVKELGVDYSQGYYFSEPLENIIID